MLCMIFLTLSITLFTFHYGSILIVIPYFRYSVTDTFTFHYGSILIKYNQLDNYYLELIYIPLWFYSNAWLNANRAILPRFTFHYGSILIQQEESQQEEEPHLHSTMVLF